MANSRKKIWSCVGLFLYACVAYDEGFALQCDRKLSGQQQGRARRGEHSTLQVKVPCRGQRLIAGRRKKRTREVGRGSMDNQIERILKPETATTGGHVERSRVQVRGLVNELENAAPKQWTSQNDWKKDVKASVVWEEKSRN